MPASSLVFIVVAVIVLVLLAVLVWPLLLFIFFAGSIAIIAAVNELVARWIGREVGCLVGGLAALAWILLIARVDHLPIETYMLIVIGIPVTVTAITRLIRRWSTRPSTARLP